VTLSFGLCFDVHDTIQLEPLEALRQDRSRDQGRRIEQLAERAGTET
jgi:hypothetical protein